MMKLVGVDGEHGVEGLHSGEDLLRTGVLGHGGKKIQSRFTSMTRLEHCFIICTTN